MKKVLLASGLVLLAVPAFCAGPDHLVLSEIATRGGKYSSSHESSEYVEIYNPTGAEVTDLTNYYLSDWTGYFTLPTATRDGLLPDLGSGDNLSHFPAGETIASGGVAVVTANGQYFLDAYFDSNLANFQALPGSPKLYEMFDSNASIPNMVNLSTEAGLDRDNLSHTDGGENQFLFYWDGASDLVQDIDMMMYGELGANLGTGNGILNKSGLGADGPDGDVVDSTYATDAGSTANLTARFQISTGADRPYQFFRRSIIEVSETQTAGNGKTGHDETLEKINVTWGGAEETTATATPGVTSLGLSSADQPPVIFDSYRTELYPKGGNTVNFGATVVDDGTITGAVLHVDNGSGTFSDVPMTNASGNLWTASITAPADGSKVKWYVSATDNASQTRSENDYQYFNRNYPGYHWFIVGALELTEDAIVFTEIQFNPVGGDNHGESEFVEALNTTHSDIDLTGYYFSTNPDNGSWQVQVPDGTIIPANGRLIFAAWKPVFLITYPAYDPDDVIDLHWGRTSVLGNGTETMSLTHQNEIGINGNTSTAAEEFEYSGMVAGSGAGNTGYTFELKDQTGPNVDQALWDVSLIPGGTPGRRNTLDNPGNIIIANNTRSAQYPTSTDAITISADVTAANSFTVKLHYTIDPGINYTTVDMTSTGGSQYSKDIGTVASGKIVKYFIEVTDTNDQVVTYPPFAAPIVFQVNDLPPATGNDLVINEIMSDPTNAENVDFSEWIEIYNRTDHQIDMSFFKIGHTTNSSPYPRVLSEGTVIPAFGYLVFAGNKVAFMNQYTEVDPGRVFDALYADSIIANGGGTAFITHANAINWTGLTWQDSGPTLDYVPYDEAAGGWPDTTNNVSRELIDSATDNTLPENWAATTQAGGTPAALNSVSTASVNDWTLY